MLVFVLNKLNNRFTCPQLPSQHIPVEYNQNKRNVLNLAE